ncbi:MAG: response regulator [Opitutaceae bacterium]|nr:response regulator [Opitutaceae bacterium]
MNCRWSFLRSPAGGEPKSILAFDTDITDRKKLEAQFIRAQRMESIGSLAGGIAHDLNNLLAPITMAVDLLRAEGKSADGVHVIEILERSARRSAGLVRQVLAFARGAQGARIVVQIRHVVDDEPSILTVTRQTLETFGYRVITAENGAEAVGVLAVERDNVAVVITDMMMPIMDGPASAMAMRKINPRLKIIGASGLDTVASSRAASAGIVHFLPKPFSTGALLTLLRVVLASEPAA